MTKLYVKVKTASPAPQDSTACPSGVFDTAARLDTQAALMRNLTFPAGIAGRDWSINHAGTPETYPQVTDHPDN
jgi:hypothetical protein